jgi:hypothetical protein
MTVESNIHLKVIYMSLKLQEGDSALHVAVRQSTAGSSIFRKALFTLFFSKGLFVDEQLKQKKKVELVNCTDSVRLVI